MQGEHALSRVGERLRSAISARGESLKAFSERAGIPYRSLQEYVAGKNKPGFDPLQKIASAGIDVGFLLTGTYSGVLFKTFAAGTKRSLLLAADEEFSQLIYEGLLSAIDSLNQNYISTTGQSLSVKRITEILSYGLTLVLSVVAEMEDSLCDLRRRGVSAAVVTAIVLDGVGKDLQRRAGAQL